MAETATYTWTSSSVAQTKQLAAALAACLQAGDAVVLNGGLGAGKTHFVQGVAEALGVAGEVTSPTFNILQIYEGRTLSLNHFDLYRLDNAEELDDIGYWEVLENSGVTFIEWGDKFPDEMPDDYLELTISASTDDTRTLTAQTCGPRASSLLTCWKQATGVQA